MSGWLPVLAQLSEPGERRSNNMEPITHGGTDAKNKPCRCYKCKEVSVCTPFNDFYTLGEDDLGPLYCEACFNVYVAKQIESFTGGIILFMPYRPPADNGDEQSFSV